MKKQLIVVDDNGFYLKKINIRLNALIQQSKLSDLVEVKLFGKENILDYRKVDKVDIALVDYSFLIPKMTINGLMICEELIASNPNVKIAMITSLSVAKKAVESFNENKSNSNKIVYLGRGFEEIEEFVLSCLQEWRI